MHFFFCKKTSGKKVGEENIKQRQQQQRCVCVCAMMNEDLGKPYIANGCHDTYFMCAFNDDDDVLLVVLHSFYFSLAHTPAQKRNENQHTEHLMCFHVSVHMDVYYNEHTRTHRLLKEIGSTMWMLETVSVSCCVMMHSIKV